MKNTKIYSLLDEKEYENSLNKASKIIIDGGIVAIPTETVYGLACDGLNPSAVHKIFEAKNRPLDNPLILHISDFSWLDKLTQGLEAEDRKIVEKLWPGPLTIVLNRKDIVPDEITAGGDTVAVRMPKMKSTRDFIDYCQSPLAAPSANLSTKPSPTNAQDVYQDMQGRIEAILDGGESKIGLESTVLDLTSDRPTILRPGFYTLEYLRNFWPDVELDLALKDQAKVPKSPGQKYKHYAPKAKVTVVVGQMEKVQDQFSQYISKSKGKIGIMTFEEDNGNYPVDEVKYMGSIDNLEEMGRHLFTYLRDMDKLGVDEILVYGVEEEGYGLSIMNRLKKSASGNVIYL